MPFRCRPLCALAALLPLPRRLRRQCPPACHDRSRRLPPAEASDRRASAARSRCRRTATSPSGRKITLSVAVLPANTLHPRAGSVVHSRGRSRPGGELPWAVRRRIDRRAQGSRHRARRSARHRPLVAARLRRLQARPQPRGGARVRSRAQGATPARASSLRRASTPRNTRRPRGSPTSMRCARRWATTRSISGAVRTARAQRRNICAATPTTCAASCSTASRRPR